MTDHHPTTMAYDLAHATTPERHRALLSEATYLNSILGDPGASYDVRRSAEIRMDPVTEEQAATMAYATTVRPARVSGTPAFPAGYTLDAGCPVRLSGDVDGTGRDAEVLVEDPWTGSAGYVRLSSLVGARAVITPNKKA